MNNAIVQPDMNCYPTHTRNHFSWSAIVLGAFFGIGISFLLNLFAFGIGLAAFKTNSAATLAIGGMLSLIVISIISMGTMGWIAGFIGGIKSLCNHNKLYCNYGCIYGFGAWCFALILSMFLVTPTSHLISHTTHAINPTLTMTVVKTYPVAVNDVNTQAPQPGLNQDNANKIDNVEQVDADKALSTTVLVAASLFSIGALSAGIGGHLGYKRYYLHERQ